jgi:hypothetical protein
MRADIQPQTTITSILLADAKFALNSAVVRGEPQEVLNELRAKVAALEVN